MFGTLLASIGRVQGDFWGALNGCLAFAFGPPVLSRQLVLTRLKVTIRIDFSSIARSTRRSGLGICEVAFVALARSQCNWLFRDRDEKQPRAGAGVLVARDTQMRAFLCMECARLHIEFERSGREVAAARTIRRNNESDTLIV